MGTGAQFCLYAVGGTARHRHLRKLLVDACMPPLASLSFALENSDESFRIPCTIEQLECIRETAKQPHEPKAMEICDKDTVLLIGSITPASFDCLVLGKKVDVWLQGPGFNYGTLAGPELGLLKDKHGSEQVRNIIAVKCPLFTLQEWYTGIFPRYPSPLQELRAYQIGNFWLTPLADSIRSEQCGDCASVLATDAFVRQFQLVDTLVRQNKIVAFHIEVLDEVMARCPNSTKLPILQKMATGLAGIDSCSSLERQFKEICQIYELNRDITDDSSMLRCFTDTLMQKMPKHSAGIREYDGFVAHQMLRSFAAMEELDASQEDHRRLHLDLVIECLRHTEESAGSEYICKLRSGKRPGRLHVLHDLGLDPQNDDWIAIQILRTAW